MLLFPIANSTLRFLSRKKPQQNRINFPSLLYGNLCVIVVFRRKAISFGNISDSTLFPARNVNFSGGFKVVLKDGLTIFTLPYEPANVKTATVYTREYYISRE